MMHYETRHLTYEQKKQLLIEAHKQCDRWWFDVLDCSKSWCRQNVDSTFDDALDHFTEKCDFHVIHRRAIPMERCLEIGFDTRGIAESYFMWVIISEDKIPEFTKNLESKKDFTR